MALGFVYCVPTKMQQHTEGIFEVQVKTRQWNFHFFCIFILCMNHVFIRVICDREWNKLKVHVQQTEFCWNVKCTALRKKYLRNINNTPYSMTCSFISSIENKYFIRKGDH